MQNQFSSLLTLNVHDLPVQCTSQVCGHASYSLQLYLLVLQVICRTNQQLNLYSSYHPLHCTGVSESKGRSSLLIYFSHVSFPFPSSYYAFQIIIPSSNHSSHGHPTCKQLTLHILPRLGLAVHYPCPHYSPVSDLATHCQILTVATRYVIFL